LWAFATLVVASISVSGMKFSSICKCFLWW
jgi:hypothetical protein